MLSRRSDVQTHCVQWRWPYPESSPLLSGYAIVISEQAAKAFFLLKPASLLSHFITRFDDPVRKPLMIALGVIMLAEPFQCPA